MTINNYGGFNYTPPNFTPPPPVGDSGSIDNDPSDNPPFDSSFNPNAPLAMAQKLEEMMKWSSDHPLSINAAQTIYNFLVNMGENYPTGQNRVVFENAMQGDITTDAQNLGQLVIDVLVQNAFYSASGTQAQIEAQTTAFMASMMAQLAPISGLGNWLPDLYGEASNWSSNLQTWMTEQFDLPTAQQINKSTWLTIEKGIWATFWQDSNTSTWIDGNYQSQIAQLVKEAGGNLSLLLILLLFLLTNQDNDGETDLGGLGDLMNRQNNYVTQNHTLITTFTKGATPTGTDPGSWSPQSAKDFFDQLTGFGFDMENDPAFSDVLPTVDQSLSSFLGTSYTPSGGTATTLGALYNSGNYTELSTALNSFMPDPKNPQTPTPFYTDGIQNMENIASSVTSMSQVTGQQVSSAQGVQQQRESTINAGFQISESLEQFINDAMRSQ